MGCSSSIHLHQYGYQRPGSTVWIIIFGQQHWWFTITIFVNRALERIGNWYIEDATLDKEKCQRAYRRALQEVPPQSIYDPEYALNNFSIDGSQISLESLKVSAVLIQDLIRKFNREARGQQVDLPLSPTQHEIKRLNDNFKKLKTDLIPVIRLLKDSKPLPTPTLDPGPAATLDSPTFSHCIW